MKWLALFWLPFVAGCRMTKFVEEDGKALENHLIKTVTVIKPILCRWQCVDTPLCFSMNVRKLPTGWVTCDLNNSSKTADPQDLISSNGRQYHHMVEASRCTVEECIYKDALPNGWYAFGQKLLKVFPTRKTWGQARKYCQSIGGELVSVTRENENEFIAHLISQINTSSSGQENNHIIARWMLDGTDVDVSLANGARYEEVDSVKSLYLDGSGAHATTPALDFSKTSFTMASWVKLQSPVTNPSTIYSDWSDSTKFLFNAWETDGKLRFGGVNQNNQFKPWLTGGSPPTGKWFHVAAVWDRKTSEVHLFQDGQKVGTESVASNSFLGDTPHTTYDIGLKRDSQAALRGHLRSLTIIGSALTADELTNISNPDNEASGGVWIGGNDVVKEGTFRWPDGTHVTYTKWALDQPDNANNYQDCVEMKVHNGTWDDTSCGRQLPFVCEKIA